MKNALISGAAIGALLIAGQASAAPTGPTGYSFTPANTAFAGSGTLTISIAGQPTSNCNLAVAGETGSHGALALTSVTLTDNGDGTCTMAESNQKNQFWNPTALYNGRWLHAKFFLSPKGIKCYGNLTLPVSEPIGGDTTIDGQGQMASAAGVCRVAYHLDIGKVVITSTPGE